ncbi:MAG: GntR family transcriptional regulator, partial [Lactobacillaceae bacterium]|nr:GntR family transcriptional regulator [Lactobacillaceae bacterium]
MTLKFIQIRDDFKKRIERGEFQRGSRLSSERELAEEYHVSRATLRQAITNLVDEGLIERKVGDGAYVKQKSIIENLRGVTSFSQLMKQTGRTPSTKFISYKQRKPSQEEALALDIKLEDDVVVLDRIRLGDGSPIAYEVAVLPATLAGSINRQELYKSLYSALENKGYRIDNASALQEFHAVNADKVVATHLNIKEGDALLYLKQTSFFSNGNPFEFVQTYYAGSRYHVYLER